MAERLETRARRSIDQSTAGRFAKAPDLEEQDAAVLGVLARAALAVDEARVVLEADRSWKHQSRTR